MRTLKASIGFQGKKVLLTLGLRSMKTNVNSEHGKKWQILFYYLLSY